MQEFTNDELKFIHDLMKQFAWKIGESKKLILAENIVDKCTARIIPEMPQIPQT